MSILIISDPWDSHVDPVRWALNAKKHSSDLWYVRDFPTKHRVNARIHGDSNSSVDQISISGLDINLPSFESIDTVWFRRLYTPSPLVGLSKSETQFVINESTEFVRSIFTVLSNEERIFKVNSLFSRRKADRKILQLKIAKNVGLEIPETLISNDAVQIKEFAKEFAEIIYKPFLPAWWTIEGKTLSTYTSLLSKELLEDSLSLEAAPGIYQAKVNKDYEVRLTIIGKSPFAAKIKSQERPQSMLDWRAHQSFDGFIEPIDVPHPILEKCYALMNGLGIVFGCFDFAVDINENYTFFEVNEMGQFLWLEAHCPELKLLDAFSDFLISPSADFKYTGSGKTIYKEYLQDLTKQNKDVIISKTESHVTMDHKQTFYNNADDKSLDITHNDILAF